jgi:hypothetical protein
MPYLQVGASRGVEQYMQYLPPSLQVLRLGVENGGYCLGEDETDDEGLDFYKRWVACVMCAVLALVCWRAG